MLDSPKAPRTAAPTNFDALHMPRSYLWTMLLGRTGVRTLQQRCAKVPAGNPGSWKSAEIPIKSNCFMLKWAVRVEYVSTSDPSDLDCSLDSPGHLGSKAKSHQISTSTSGPKAISCRTLKLNISMLFHVPSESSEPWPTWRPTTILGMCCMRFTRHWIRPAQTLEKSWDDIAWRDNTEEISHSPFIWWLKYKKVECVTVDHLNPNTFANLHFPPSMATILRFQPGANHASRPNALKLRVFLPCSSPNWSKLRFFGEKNSEPRMEMKEEDRDWSEDVDEKPLWLDPSSSSTPKTLLAGRWDTLWLFNIAMEDGP